MNFIFSFSKDENGEEHNQYVKAIQAVARIVEDYDSDRKFPIYGFGARLEDETISHKFPLTFDEENPAVDGMDGIIGNGFEKIRIGGARQLTREVTKLV